MSENFAPNSNMSVEQTYQKKTQIEHVLLRPDTYIGAVECERELHWCLETPDAACESEGSPSEQIVLRAASISPGLLKIFDEILVNAADNKQRDPSMSKLHVRIDAKAGVICVRNDGKGIPIVIHKEHQCYVPELIFGHLLTSSNYDDTQKKTTGGRNGYGAKLANIFSKRFTVITQDTSRGLLYSQVFEANMSKMHKPVIEKSKGKSDFTEIEFEPDLSKFKGQNTLRGDAFAVLSRRVYDIAGTSTGLKVYLNKNLINMNGFASYITKFRGGDEAVVCEKPNDRWEIGVACSNESHFVQMSWVNSIATTRGGTHVAMITDQVVKIITEHIEKKHKKIKVKPTQVKNHLAIYVNCLIENPTFDTQTKECLTSKKSTFGSSCELSEKFAKIIISKTTIVDNVLSFAALKETKELSKNDGKKSSRISGIPKLDDANDAGTKDGHQCTLILTEGDSAKALAVSGLSVVGRDRYGVFPLRGKLLNVREATVKQISENAEFIALKKILGLQQNKVYKDATSLRYGHVMIMTDQDHDGSHIKGLIINLFAVFWPSLLSLPGFLTEFITPIVKVKNAARKAELSFFTLPEFNTWRETQQQNGTLHLWTIKYYKGLGTSTAVEAQAYFSAIPRHQLTFVHTSQCPQAIELAFGKSLADARKEWLQTWNSELFLDQSHGSFSYTDFVHRELILFSVASNQRAIPSLVDGFKPGQRKILFACFLKRLKAEIKVAQLAGFVAEKSAYHHGEQALTSTIVNMAQDYCGSNNLNLLVPSGMFGTRLAGGKDAASARYIFTALQPLTRLIFHEADEPILKHLQDDGMTVEPEYYLPIIPMVLVNGSAGIGTGWSSSIPNYSPLDLIDTIVDKLEGRSSQQLIPHYSGFTGKIVRSGASKYTHYGVIEVVNRTTLVISELPLEVWVNDYKVFLESLLEEQDIKSYREYHTEKTVNFVLTLTEEKLSEFELEGLHKKFKLMGSLSTNNMVLFDQHHHLKRYESPEQILDEFFVIRREAYVQRKDSLVSVIKQNLMKLSNKSRFIVAVCTEQIKIRQVAKAKVIQQLVDQNYDRIMPSTKKEASNDSNEDDDKEPLDDSSAGFDYLLSMPLWSLTQERVNELNKAKSMKEAELTALIATSPDNLWIHDLMTLKTAIIKHNEAESKREAKAVEQALVNGATRKETKKSVKGLGLKEVIRHGIVVEPPVVLYDGSSTPKKKKVTKKTALKKDETSMVIEGCYPAATAITSKKKAKPTETVAARDRPQRAARGAVRTYVEVSESETEGEDQTEEDFEMTTKPVSKQSSRRIIKDDDETEEQNKDEFDFDGATSEANISSPPRKLASPVQIASEKTKINRSANVAGSRAPLVDALPASSLSSLSLSDRLALRYNALHSSQACKPPLTSSSYSSDHHPPVKRAPSKLTKPAAKRSKPVPANKPKKAAARQKRVSNSEDESDFSDDSIEIDDDDSDYED